MRHALILAAGRGERMRPLTDTTPKPLLLVHGKPLIAHHIEKLAAIGVNTIVVNTAHLADRFPEALGDGSQWGVRIHYSYEGPEPLETGGGMLKALPLLGDKPFIVVSADIWSDFDYATLPAEPLELAHLVMVPNPKFHPKGDFSLCGDRLHDSDAPPDAERLTFGNIGVYRRELVSSEAPGKFQLGPLYRRAIAQGRLTGEKYTGFWRNVGTPAQLDELRDVTRQR
ncbi:MAG: N-acetylmuramate alpha-1-phosphate uridylyltransferase [Luteibacter sp.]|uniref:N-acetylmuramate alpha-1-phosphate uridylyltransferase MurU n=1 Tax=Luteibacter sp. TaxID=1886636 RepID=UPI0013865176|nr:nucleotidyltransferase family protein [Luteibacter sp.]KAF1004254.1 MAG: N-acetylmuramate alpha-1-phosphate uridylyltransferase [Luteibacter sp.]